MATYFPKEKDLTRRWHVVDAKGQILGRLASHVANILSGKLKPSWVPFLDTGDHVIVINADKVLLTGQKLEQKLYRRHSGYPGGLKSVSARDLKASKPHRLVEEAVKGMLPKNKIGRAMVKKLKVYTGDHHPHQAQKPEESEISR
jgi:large subunit ribosomal protein L13